MNDGPRYFAGVFSLLFFVAFIIVIIKYSDGVVDNVSVPAPARLKISQNCSEFTEVLIQTDDLCCGFVCNGTCSYRLNEGTKRCAEMIKVN